MASSPPPASAPHFFAQVPSWTTVPSALPLAPFLAAAEGLARIFDAIGALSLAPVKADFLKNVQRLRRAGEELHRDFPLDTLTLHNVLEHEKAAGRTRGECALVSYFWLYHSFRMIDAAFTRWSTTTEELRACFEKAYHTTLYPLHTWLQYGAFKLAMAGIPTRAYLMSRLRNPPAEVVQSYFHELHRVVASLPEPHSHAR
jgi:hypothetical protein